MEDKLLLGVGMLLYGIGILMGVEGSVTRERSFKIMGLICLFLGTGLIVYLRF